MSSSPEAAGDQPSRPTTRWGRLRGDLRTALQLTFGVHPTQTGECYRSLARPSSGVGALPPTRRRNQ